MSIKNALDQLFSHKSEQILSLFCTAEYPQKGDTRKLLDHLYKAEVDMIELGIPFSDPVADGNTIQEANAIALSNGANLKMILDSLSKQNLDSKPILLMGYLNPFLQYGIEELCKRCNEIGIAGLIIPDLPPELFCLKYESISEKYGVHFIHLISPESSDDRIRFIDAISTGFIYAVSSNSTTGNEQKGNNQAFLERIKASKLKNKVLLGFNIRNHSDYALACQYTNGTIIGSQFIRHLNDNGLSKVSVDQFVNSIKYAQIHSL